MFQNELSPLLFAVFIDDLTDCRSRGAEFKGTFFISLFYSEDIVMLSTSSHSQQLMNNHMYKYCTICNLEVHRNKSKIMFFGKGVKEFTETEGALAVEVVKEFRYLEVCLTKNVKLIKSKSSIGAT